MHQFMKCDVLFDNFQTNKTHQAEYLLKSRPHGLFFFNGFIFFGHYARLDTCNQHGSVKNVTCFWYNGAHLENWLKSASSLRVITFTFVLQISLVYLQWTAACNCIPDNLRILKVTPQSGWKIYLAHSITRLVVSEAEPQSDPYKRYKI